MMKGLTNKKFKGKRYVYSNHFIKKKALLNVCNA